MHEGDSGAVGIKADLSGESFMLMADLSSSKSDSDEDEDSESEMEKEDRVLQIPKVQPCYLILLFASFFVVSKHGQSPDSMEQELLVKMNE